MITIELTEEDALLFRKFREHQDTFKVLEVSGVFNVRSGDARLHFNLEGVLEAVDLGVPTYRRGQKQKQFLSLK